MYYLKIIIPSLNIEFLTYKSEDDISVGQIVSVPYRNKQKLGIVIDYDTKTDFPEEKIKCINNIENFCLSNKLLEFLSKSSKYYLSSISKFCKLSLPNEKFLAPPKKSTNHQNLDFQEAELSQSQLKAYQEIKSYGKGFNAIVLEGVTGSGKTEIYLKYIEEILKNTDKQVLILLPEIALTTQLEKKIQQRFGESVPMWHSNTSNSKKHKIYQAIISGEQRLIIGARSALYLPYKNLGLIIVDEEHDQSYKQEELVLYNARDMAVMRSYIENFPVILTSATPSLETLNNIENGSYKHVTLTEKFSNKFRPEFKIVDMKLYKMPPDHWLSQVMVDEVKQCLSQGNQALLFLNRRGYAPLNLCSACGYRLSCNSCSCWLVAHKEKGKYVCHHCGYEKKITNICPSCEAENTIRAVGPGVEKIYEEIRTILPEAKPIILSKDNFSSLTKIQEIMDAIHRKEYNLLIGTQVIAKGFHFPDLTLVGIIDNDIAFAGGDLRSHEKTFQLLEQVSGRSAREKPGKVIIQTYEPDHILIQSVINDNKNLFIEKEKKQRKAFSMPPYGKLTSLVFKAKNEKKLSEFVHNFAKKAPLTNQCILLGPTPASLVKMGGQYRYKILLKTSKKFDISLYLSKWLSTIKIPSYINFKIDIDPYSFL